MAKSIISEGKTSTEAIEKGLKEFKNRKVIIFDTAGRHKEEADLIAEMNELDDIINPKYSIETNSFISLSIITNK